jgi:hypothetical protein
VATRPFLQLGVSLGDHVVASGHDLLRFQLGLSSIIIPESSNGRVTVILGRLWTTLRNSSVRL